MPTLYGHAQRLKSKLDVQFNRAVVTAQDLSVYLSIC